jgi:phosphatidate cytidylyltransferase
LLKKRLISAAIVIGGTLTFVALDIWANNFGCPGIWLLPLAFYLILGSSFECATMIGPSLGSIRTPAMLGTLAIMIAGCMPMLWPLGGSNYPADCGLGKLGWPLAATAIVQVSCFAWFFSTFKAHSGTFMRASLAGWVSAYFGVCFAFAVGLRLIDPTNWGLFVLVGIIVVTKSSDAGAYFTGRLLGSRKLCPAVSPNKTIEGFVGGAVVACVVAWLYFNLGTNALFDSKVSLSVGSCIALGWLLTVTGLAGDLLESMFKREFCIKDSGNLLPGLGGLWDITDSLLPAFVVGYLFFQAS